MDNQLTPDPLLLEEARRRGLLPGSPLKQQNSSLDYLMTAAGLSHGDLSKALLTNEPLNSIGLKMIRGAPGTIGGMVGASAGPAGALIGGTAGEALRQAGIAANAAFGNTQPPTINQAVINPTNEGLGQFAGDIGMRGLGAVGGMVAKPIAGLIKSTTGIARDTAESALRNLSILFTAKPVKAAGEALGNLAESKGIATGAEGWKLAYGTRFSSPDLAKEVADNILDGGIIDAVTKQMRPLTSQELYSAREIIQKALLPENIRNNPVLKENYRTLVRAITSADDQLESILPGYAARRGDYRNAMIKEAFSRFWPTNQNQTESFFRVIGMLGLGTNAGYQQQHGGAGGPSLLGAAAMSPLLTGIGLRGAYAGSLAAAPLLRTALSQGTQSFLNR